jgi:hypothetical protein
MTGTPKREPRNAAVNRRSPQSEGSNHNGVTAPGKHRGKQCARKPVEARAREAIKEECGRQRAALSRKEAADSQMTLLTRILEDLLSQKEFITVLKAAGFIKIPRLVRQRLQMQPEECRAAPSGQNMASDTARCQQSRPTGDLAETAGLIQDKMHSARTIEALNRMTPTRRIAVANLMSAVDKNTGDFAYALLLATPEDQRTATAKAHRSNNGPTTRSFTRIERQLIDLQTKNQALSASYNDNLFYLALFSGHVRGWIHSRDVFAWLHSRYALHTASLLRMVQEADDAKQPRRRMKVPHMRDIA